mmetsp:Transcript_39171/g.81538  ORF Transcript_39171/g.81538 Transcript_39171/m.81538 type:complete len:89 (-) Transcript_39171:253-519(-)
MHTLAGTRVAMTSCAIIPMDTMIDVSSTEAEEKSCSKGSARAIMTSMVSSPKANDATEPSTNQEPAELQRSAPSSLETAEVCTYQKKV